MIYNFINPTLNTFEVKIYNRNDNNFGFESEPIICKASVVGQNQIKMFRLQQGVQGNDHSTYLRIDNLPEEVKLGSKVIFNGEEHTIQSIGYFFEEMNIINASLFNEEYIKARCPKGIAIS